MTIPTDAIIQGVQAGASLIPGIIALIDGAVHAGELSPEDAAALRHDITSRRTAYMRQKAEDEAALQRKHGVPDELVDPWADTKPPGGTGSP